MKVMMQAARHHKTMKGEIKMGLITITPDSPDDLFKAPEFPVLPAGKHLFVVANRLEVISKEGKHPLIKLEARCQDDDSNKGMVVFENFLLIGAATTEDEATAKRIHDARLAQFVCACGVSTPEKITNKEPFDLSDCDGKYFNAITTVRNEPVYPEELDDKGNPKKALRARIRQFLYEAPQAK